MPIRKARDVAHRDLAAFALIVSATFLAYAPALRGGLVWDDASHVTRAGLRSWHGLWRIWFDPGATQQYYPLLHTAFWIEHAIWGDAVLGYHLVNVALHAFAACLVVCIVRRLALPGAWFAGLLFALHPLAVEAVAWISEQKSTLSGVFCLAAALAYLHFEKSRRRSHCVAAMAFFLLALLSKTVAATLPAALLVLIWWQRGRIEWRRDVRPLIPWFVLGVSAGLCTAWVERTLIGAAGPEFALTPLQRLLLAGRAVCFYAWKIAWPANLTFFYPRWKIDAADWRQYLFPGAVAAVAFLFWRLSRRNRGPLAAFLIFTCTLFPALGFVNVYPFRYSYVADHFAYLASLAILVPVAAAIAVSAKRFLPSPPSRVLAPAALLAVLGVLSWRQAGIYRTEESLYRATLERNPDAWLAHNNLGNLLLPLGGRRAEAIEHFQAALRLKPDFWEAHLSMGNALLAMPGHLRDAIGEYQTATQLAPQSERTETNLGNALLHAGRAAEAIPHLEAALRIQPDNAEAHNDLGNAFARMPGRLPDAIAEYHEALRAQPGMPEAHNNLGRVLAQTGRMPEAIAEFESAIRANPNSWSAHSNLGNALSQTPGRLNDAIGEYRLALRIDPDSAPAHNNLAYALAHLPGHLPEAIAEYRKALQLDPEFADAHYNLATALFGVPGHRAEVLAEFEATLRLRPSPQLQRMVAQIRAQHE